MPSAEQTIVMRPTMHLERLTEPSALVKGDEGASQGREGEVDVGASFITDGEATEAGKPRQGAFHDPAVSSQALAALDAPAGDARYDPARPAFAAAAPMVVGLVRVQLVRPAARATAPA